MKKTITSIFALAILFTSCGEAADSTDSKSATPEPKAQVDKVAEENLSEGDESPNLQYKEGEVETEVEELLMPEGSAVEGDDRYANISSESAISECYIVSHFIDMDITYVTVDFVVIEEDTENGGYEIVNDNPKLRTFVVNEEYLNPYQEKNVSIDEIFKKALNDSEMLFSITTKDGLVTELYENLAG